MKVTLKSHETTVTVESEFESGSIQDYFEAFESCLKGVTFDSETIRDYVIEWAEDIKLKREHLQFLADHAQKSDMGYKK